MRLSLTLMALSVSALLGACARSQSTPPDKTVVTETYTNPLTITVPAGGAVESCADPAIIQARSATDHAWYLYCTSDPHSAQDTGADGQLRLHLITSAKSDDLVHWTYVGDVFSQRPAWVRPDAGLWAPDIEYRGGKYFLYFTASDTAAGGSAIGVATSASPAGPWTDSGAAVVEPQPPANPEARPTDRRWVFDPDVTEDDSGQAWIYYGSYYGGLSVRKLSADGLHTDPASQVQVAIDNRYEGAQVVRHGGYYYLMGSATDCCRGPLTGYSVFAGRSVSPTGPFVDREGQPLLGARVGGTPVLSMNGNRWVGTGHHAVFTDAGGQDWTVYHAVDLSHPYFTPGGINRRPALLDPLDWVNGWPTVRGGLGASDVAMPAPAAQAGQLSAYRTPAAPVDAPGTLLPEFSDEFNEAQLDARWSWVRPPAPGVAALDAGAFSMQTQAAELQPEDHTASVLTEAAPAGDYLVETKLDLNLPDSGCCDNYAQGGLVIYGDDANYVKLAVVSIFNTRQTEFGKEVGPVPEKYPHYGNTVVGAPGRVTWLRVVRRAAGAGETYTAYTSRDGVAWVRGGTWTHTLGKAKIGLVSMNQAGFVSRFDYVRTYTLAP